MDNLGNLSIIISIGIGVFTIVASMIMMLLWIRGEANTDRRALTAICDAIKDEMKDFHVRLISIEKERTKIIIKNMEN